MVFYTKPVVAIYAILFVVCNSNKSIIIYNAKSTILRIA